MFPFFPDHYRWNGYTRVFDVSDRMVCINITLFDDNILENVDFIDVSLRTPPSLIPYVSYDIDDDDGE